MNTFTLAACFHHELHTGPYFMTFAPRLYCNFKEIRMYFDKLIAFSELLLNVTCAMWFRR